MRFFFSKEFAEETRQEMVFSTDVYQRNPLGDLEDKGAANQPSFDPYRFIKYRINSKQKQLFKEKHESKKKKKKFFSLSKYFWRIRRGI